MSEVIQKKLDEFGHAFEVFKRAVEEKNSTTEKNALEAINKFEAQIEEIKVAANRSAISEQAAEANERKAEFAKLTRFVKSSKPGESMETKGYNVTGDSGVNGGVAVPSVLDTAVVTLVTELSPIRKIATVKTVGVGTYEGIINLNNAAVAKSSETGTRNATNTNTFAPKSIKTHEMYAYPTATLEMLEDVFFNAEAELLRAVGEGFAVEEGADFVFGVGDGSNEAKGFQMYTMNDISDGSLGDHDKLNTIDSAAVQSVVADDLINLQDALAEKHATKGTFVLPRKILNGVRKLKAGSDQRLVWEPSFHVGTPSLILGSPYVVAADMPSVLVGSPALESCPIVFADWKEFYYVVDRVGLSVQRDPLTSPGFVKFYFRKRQGGGIWNGRAGVGLKVKQS